MEDYRRVNGWSFKFDKENGMYECRGEVHYDDDHDEQPEPELWDAAMKLEGIMLSEGHLVEANHSEKGWVEVTILKNKE
jgi:hypothetical protein